MPPAGNRLWASPGMALGSRGASLAAGDRYPWHAEHADHDDHDDHDDDKRKRGLSSLLIKEKSLSNIHEIYSPQICPDQAFHQTIGLTPAQNKRQEPKRTTSIAMSMFRSTICLKTFTSTFSPDGPKISLSIPIRRTSAWLKGWKSPMKEAAKSKSHALTKKARKSRHQIAADSAATRWFVTSRSNRWANAALTNQHVASNKPCRVSWTKDACFSTPKNEPQRLINASACQQKKGQVGR